MAVSSCQKMESMLSSGAASRIKSPTDIIIISDVLQRCSQLTSAHPQARTF